MHVVVKESRLIFWTNGNEEVINKQFSRYAGWYAADFHN